MKSNTRKVLCLAILLLSTFCSCKKEEITTEGILKIVMSNKPHSFYIYPIEIADLPFIYYISDFPYSSEYTYSLNLNSGNYTTQPMGDSYYSKVNLQI